MSDFIKGKNLRLKFDGKWLWHSTSCGIDSSSKSDSLATKDTTGDVVVVSGYNYTLSIEGIYAKLPNGNTTHITGDDLFVKHVAGEMIEWEMASADGKYVYSGFLYITSAGLTAPVEGMATNSFGFTGTGDLVITPVT